MRREITLAAGCFWGTQAFFDRIKGVKKTIAGYANGNIPHVNYEMVSTQNTNFVEAVRIVYDDQIVSLEHLLDKYFQVVDPTLKNRQGNDIGTQYRTGIYYYPSPNPQNLAIIKKVLAREQLKYSKPIVVEVQPLRRFVVAEDYHQKYLDKNPHGYCHIDLNKSEDDA